jgi:hypothetical protein
MGASVLFGKGIGKSNIRKLWKQNDFKPRGESKMLDKAKELYKKKPQLVKFGGIVVLMLVLSLLFGG